MYYSKKTIYTWSRYDRRKEKEIEMRWGGKNVIFPFYINAKMILKMILKLDQKKNISSCVY